MPKIIVLVEKYCVIPIAYQARKLFSVKTSAKRLLQVGVIKGLNSNGVFEIKICFLGPFQGKYIYILQ